MSHASEDKATVAEPLARRLQAAGLEVWLDRDELRLGDSLRRKLDEGLLNARFGVVVFSPSFFRKEWPQRELEALLALEIAHGKRVLPVLHDLDRDTLLLKAPLLLDKVSISTTEGLDVVARAILHALGEPVTDVPPNRTFDPNVFIGTAVHGYTLITHIGSGGSGSVFAVAHPRYQGKLALKIFFPLKSGYQHLLTLFEKGFRAVAAVRHPNVVGAIDVGYCVIDGAQTAFMVTEFITGARLDDWARDTTDAQRDPAKFEIAIALAEGFAECHATKYIDEVGFETQGVFHGDIKPANIIVDGDDRPHIIDFLQIDVQRLIESRTFDPQTKVTRSLTGAFGTPGFMAPEQERYGTINVGTEVYGLGMTLAHLFGGSLKGILYGRQTRSELRNLILGMVSPDPAERPRSMKAVLDQLVTVAGNRRA